MMDNLGLDTPPTNFEYWHIPSKQFSISQRDRSNTIRGLFSVRRYMLYIFFLA